MGQSELFPGLKQAADPGGAHLSMDRVYRYRLWRIWSLSGGSCLFVMLNPSTADEREDDATIRRCVNYSKAWGFGSLRVANMYALRSKHPKDLKAHPDPVGPENDHVLADEAKKAARIVVAWGNVPSLGGAEQRRIDHVLSLLRAHSPLSLVCLGVTKEGHPLHPVRQPKAAELQLYTR